MSIIDTDSICDWCHQPIDSAWNLDHERALNAELLTALCMVNQRLDECIQVNPTSESETGGCKKAVKL